MNMLVQAEKYANEPAIRCNSSIAAFILFYFKCAAGLSPPIIKTARRGLLQ